MSIKQTFLSAYKGTFVSAFLLCVSPLVWATDPTQSTGQSGKQSFAYAEIGFDILSASILSRTNSSPQNEDLEDHEFTLEAILDGRLQYKGLFVEVVEESFSNLTFGYSLFNNAQASLELVASTLIFDIERTSIGGVANVENETNDMNLGIRGSYFLPDIFAQLEITKDVAGVHDGLAVALHLGHQRQWYNWNVYGLAGLRYFSDDVVNHFFGVPATESTDTNAEYRGSFAFMPSLQLGADIPLAEDWTFNLKVEYTKFPDSIADSPLTQGSDFLVAGAGIRYVLFN